jgi:transposase-like protein
MEEARDDVLAYMTLKSHWSKNRSTNPLERLNRGIKRCTNVASIFPNGPPSFGSPAQSCSSRTTRGR